jgi:hypothetical protein
MKFHHHQLEKIRKHQRSHSRVSASSESAKAPLCPELIAELAAKGLEFHDPTLWNDATTARLRYLVRAYLAGDDSGVSELSKEAFSDFAGRLRETRPLMWQTIAGELRHTEPTLGRVTSGQCLLHYRVAVNGGATINGTGEGCCLQHRST